MTVNVIKASTSKVLLFFLSQCFNGTFSFFPAEYCRIEWKVLSASCKIEFLRNSLANATLFSQTATLHSVPEHLPLKIEKYVCIYQNKKGLVIIVNVIKASISKVLLFFISQCLNRTFIFIQQ